MQILAAIASATKMMSRFKVVPPPREQVAFRPIFRSTGLRDRRFRLKDFVDLVDRYDAPEISAAKSLPEILAEFERHVHYRLSEAGSNHLSVVISLTGKMPVPS